MIPAVATTASSSPTTSKWLPKEQRIQMAIRMRPLNSREKKSPQGKNTVWRVDKDRRSILQTTAEGVHHHDASAAAASAGNVNHRVFEFAQSSAMTFDDRSSNREVYDDVVKGVVSDVLHNGNDKTICAYGQIASGKTFTMQGKGRIGEVSSSGDHNSDDDDENNDNLGIIHMAARDIFEWIDDADADDDDHRSVRVSYVEIFNEEVRDLLQTQSRSPSTKDLMANDVDVTLRIVDSKLVNPKTKKAESFDGLMAILAEGEKNRHVAATSMNDRCSRSHTFLRFTMESITTDTDNDNNDNGEVASAAAYSTTSTLTLVDLAGSESAHNSELQQRPPPRQKTYTEPLQRVVPTHHNKKAAKKTGRIKESLLVLSRVINCLGGTSGVDKPPFRESKLTQLLKPALLGENGALAIVFCVSPSEAYVDETISTLKFAERAGQAKPQRSSSTSVASERRVRISLVGERDDGVGVGGQRRRINLSEGTAATPSGGKNTPGKRRSRLVSPYKRHSPAASSPRRATLGQITITTAPSSKVEPHETMAEKTARISFLEAKLREAERKLGAQACEVEALRSNNRELESRLGSPRKSRRVNGDRLGGSNQQLTTNVPIIGEDCSGQDTLASSFQSEDYPGSPNDVVNVAAIHFGGAAEELANGRAKIDRLERLVSRLQGENRVLRGDADPAEKEGGTSASELDGDESIRTPRVSEANEGASLLDGKALDFGAGYSTFEGTAKRGDYSSIPMNHRRATQIVDRFERISDLIETVMGIAGESS